MSKKEKKEKEVEEPKEGKAPAVSKNKLSFKGRLFLIFMTLLGLAFLPTSMLLFVGMLPSMVAFFLAPMGVGARAATVSAMNLAGCLPFVLKLWSLENDFETSFMLVSDPQVITIMYMSAAFGYMIDWVVTGIVSSFLYQKGLTRMEAIKKRQEVLISQWGEGVTGKKMRREDMDA